MRRTTSAVLRVLATTSAIGTLAACSDELPTSGSAKRTGASLQQVTSLSACGVEQLRGNGLASAAAGDTAIQLHGPVGSNPGGGVPIRGMTVYANFPKQWYGTNGYMSFGTIYVNGSNQAEMCHQYGDSQYGEPFDVPVVTDSAEAEEVPDGVDPNRWRSLPAAVRRLILDLATLMAQKTGACDVPAEIGDIACTSAKALLVAKLVHVFDASHARTLNDIQTLQLIAYNTQYPARMFDDDELLKVHSFLLGCGMQTRLRYDAGIVGYLTDAEAEDWSARLIGTYETVGLRPDHQYLAPVLGEFVLSGAGAARAGNSCLNVAQNLVLAPRGSNRIYRGGLNGGGDDGSTQF